MAFTPTPGTGDLTGVDPQFTDPANLDFSPQPGSPCISSGRDGYDRGAVWYTNRLAPVRQLNISIADSASRVSLQWENPLQMLDGSPAPTNLGALIYRNDSLVADLPDLSAGETVQFSDSLPRPGHYFYRISAYHPQGLEGIRRRTAQRWGGGKLEGFVVWDLDPSPISRDALVQTLNQIRPHTKIFLTTDPNELDLTSDVKAVFVLLGVQPGTYLMGEGSSNRLIIYLANGGNVYLEGGDFWSDPLQQALAVSQYFHIDALGSGQNNFAQADGVPGSLMDGLSFAYGGNNISVDEITNQYDSDVIMVNPANGRGCAVAYNAYMYRTIGASFQFGGLADGDEPNTKSEYLQRVLNFFNIPTGIADSPGGPTSSSAESFELSGNYPNPFNSATTISFYASQKGTAEMQVFDLLGRQVRRLKITGITPGRNEHTFSAEGLASGIYLYRLRYSVSSETRTTPMRKMIYVR